MKTAFEKGRTTARRVASLVLSLAVLCGAVLAIGAAGLRLADIRPMAEQTGSMEPEISPGDLVLASELRAAQARKGDVLTFDDPGHPGRTVTHRVVSVRREKSGKLAFVTQGDANRGSERWTIAAAGTVGRVETVVPEAGVLLRPMDGRRFRALLMMVLTALSCAIALSRIWTKPEPACSPAV